MFAEAKSSSPRKAITPTSAGLYIFARKLKATHLGLKAWRLLLIKRSLWDNEAIIVYVHEKCNSTEWDS